MLLLLNLVKFGIKKLTVTLQWKFGGNFGHSYFTR